ncbi:MAG TPA: fibronectin/fibrinogen-binding protein [Clostridiales bacterium]|nr:fibronectin/fibrinogen-binding protein [Clostridiales bacterium]
MRTSRSITRPRGSRRSLAGCICSAARSGCASSSARSRRCCNMPMDAVFLHGLTRELTQSLTGARIDKVQQPERDLLLLSVRTQSGNAKLLVHGGVGSARVHFTAGTFENPAEPPMFCMLLRKHLVGARITGISQPDFERMLVLDLDGRDELGTPVKKQLIVEMLGRQSNVILVSADGHIIDCMRRVDSSMSETRQVQPGLFYRLPLRQDKPVLFDTTPEQRAQLLSGPVTAATLDKWLLGLFSGVSPLLCREVCFRALGDASPRLERLDDAQRARLEHELDALVFSVETNNLVPTMLLDGDRPKDFSAVPILQYQDALECRGCGSFSELLDEFYLRRDKAEAMRRRSQELTHQVRTLRDRTAKKLAIQQSDLLRCADREALRQKADLIKANLYRIQKGDRTVTVQDYYAEGCPDVTIELDPRKSPQENAAALYKSYRKAKTAEQHLTGLIAEASRNLDYLNSVLDELARAESERDLADIRAELRATGYLRQPRNAKKEKTAQRAPLAFVSSTGYEILIGRSNTQNDELTHRTARRTDIWLHVQKVHGSHVIIRAHDTTPDDQTIAEAASLAVYYSQARGGGKTPVDYTMARFVRKPSGALPGMVLYTDYQTCMAESNEALVERLRVR